MRIVSRSLFLVLAVIGVAGLLVATSGASTGGPVAVEYGKKAKKKKQKAIKKATKAIANGRYVGRKGGSMPDAVDWTICKNGKYELRTTGYYDGMTGISKGKGWRISDARQTKRGWWAILQGKGGLSVALAKYGKQWKVGFERFDEAVDFGNAERTNAKSACKSL